MSTSSTTPASNTAFSTPNVELSSAASVITSSEYTGLDPAAIDDAILRSLLQKVDLKDIEQTLISIAKEAGQIMLDAHKSAKIAEVKANSSDLVTETDPLIEKLVNKRLAERYPTYLFLGEETLGDGQTLTDEPTFVCDPIDGTLNFIKGHRNYCISLALTVAKKTVVGVIYAPRLGDMYTAIKGQGAYLTRWDGSRELLPVYQQNEPLLGLKKCIPIIEMGKERQGTNWALRHGTATRLMTSGKEGGPMCQSIRVNGSCALSFCYVAEGSLDMLWESGCKIWDVCAGWLIVEEAGGIIAGANPGEWNPTLEGRSYFPVRPAPSGQIEVIEELWSYMDGKSFVYED